MEGRCDILGAPRCCYSERRQGRRGRAADVRCIMKKTYVTTMPNHIGAFLQASRCFARLGVNITRVSYNKAVDSHTLFIDAEGTEESLRAADEELTQIGYLPKTHAEPHVVLVEFRLRDEPGGVTQVLELIEKFQFNISYISSQENGTEYQLFKMGLFVENPQDMSAFLSEAEKLCQVRLINYNRSERVYDNSIFYNAFVSGLVEAMNGTEDDRSQLMINANLAMQTLDEKGQSPYRTFDSISRFAELLAVSKGEAFSPRITRHEITPQTAVTVIEPPCGSNTMIVESKGEALFIDVTGMLMSQICEEVAKIVRREASEHIVSDIDLKRQIAAMFE